MQQSGTSWVFLFWVAARNLAARNMRYGLSFMTTISVLGVAIGVAALIIVLSVMGGYEQDLKSKMLRGQPHLEVLATNALAGFSLREHPLASFTKLLPEAIAAEPFTQADVVIKQGKHLATVVVFGVNASAADEDHLWGFSTAMKEGKLGDIAGLHRPLLSSKGGKQEWPGIVLGEGLAGQLGANLGDEVVVISPSARGASSFLSGGTIARHYVVVGLFQTGLFSYDSKWAVVSLPEGRRFLPDYEPSLDEEEYVTGVAINVEEPYLIEASAAKIAALEGLKPSTWKLTNSALLFALTLEKFTMGSILMLIVLVAAFSISGTMMMSVFHKRTQVSLFRALGMTRYDIGRLFLLHGMGIGFVGIVLGLACGLGSCFLIEQLHQLPLPSILERLKTLPVKYLPRDYIVICLTAWLLSLLGALYPALTAARQDPSSGLRYS